MTASRLEELRLLTRVARMYHEDGLRQGEIAASLHLSQPRVSRLLRRATETGIVRTVVTPPPGLHAELEDRLRDVYGLLDAVVADASEDGRDVTPALGAATAAYLETTLTSVGVPVGSDLDRRVLGISVEQIRGIDRRIGVAGGSRKLPAIRAALLGGWINVLVTDAASAQHLVDAARS